METITYGKVGEEDIQVGRSTFEVTLGDGRIATLSEVNLDSFDKLLSEDTSTTNDVGTVLTIRQTSSGTPAAGLGSAVLFQAESADENPSDVGQLEFAFDDVTAGSEDSTFWVRLRAAGNALARAFGFRNTGSASGYFLLSGTATGNRTVTLQDATDTLVGRATTDTLTNKTLTDSLHNAGSGSETFRPNGLINVDLTAGSTGANTSETVLISYALPASTLSANNRGVRVRTWGTFATNANNKTVKLYFGTSVVSSNNVSVSPNGNAFLLSADVFRTGASSQDAIGDGKVGNIPQSVTFNLPSEDTTGAITIEVTGQNGTAQANEITAEGLTVEYLNG